MLNKPKKPSFGNLPFYRAQAATSPGRAGDIENAMRAERTGLTIKRFKRTARAGGCGVDVFVVVARFVDPRTKGNPE